MKNKKRPRLRHPGPSPGKKPIALFDPEPSKKPAAIPDNPRKRNPVWSVGLIDLALPPSYKWGWHHCKDAEMAIGLLKRLSILEKMTWEQLIAPDKSHYIDFDKLCPEARRRLSELKLDDIDELFSLRVFSEKRVWGILDGHVLKILWWDPKHKVYPVEKDKADKRKLKIRVNRGK